MGGGIAFELVLLGGVALLAWRLRREIRLRSATLLVIPIAIGAIIVMQREMIAAATGLIGPLAALLGLLAGLVVATRSYVRVEPGVGAVVVRATWLSLLVWPGTLALYLIGRRALVWSGAETVAEALDGAFLIGVATLLLAERGWLFYAYRHAVAPAQRRLR